MKAFSLFEHHNINVIWAVLGSVALRAGAIRFVLEKAAVVRAQGNGSLENSSNVSLDQGGVQNESWGSTAHDSATQGITQSLVSDHTAILNTSAAPAPIHLVTGNTSALLPPVSLVVSNTSAARSPISLVDDWTTVAPLIVLLILVLVTICYCYLPVYQGFRGTKQPPAFSIKQRASKNKPPGPSRPSAADGTGPPERNKHVHKDMVVYEWDQTVAEVCLYFEVPAELSASDIEVTVRGQQLEVGRKGMQPFLRADTFDEVMQEACAWSFHETGELEITMRKFQPKDWPCALVRHDPKSTVFDGLRS